MASQAGTHISVRFVHHGIKSKDFELTDGLTCHEVLKQCFNHVSKALCTLYGNDFKICTPKYLIMFGLSVYPDNKIWLPHSHTFVKHQEKIKIYQFRVRFYPHREKINFEDGHRGVMHEYLFLQLLNDFLMGNLGATNKFDDKKMFKLLSISFLMPASLPFDNSVLVNEQFKGQQIRLWSLKNKISKTISKRLITQLWIDHFWIWRGLKDNINKMKNWRKSLGYHKQKFFTELMDTDPYYWIEQYTATYCNNEFNRNQEVSVTVNFNEFNHQPCLFFGETLKYSLTEIFDIKIQRYNFSGAKDVMISSRNETPTLLEFKEEGASESFVSMLQSFAMLFVCYNICLSNELQTFDIKIRHDLHSFGPLELKSARNILSNSELNNSRSFIIHESLTQFGHYTVVAQCKSNQQEPEEILDIDVTDENTIKLFKNETLVKCFENCKLLRHYLREEYQTQKLPKDYPGAAEINKMFQIDVIQPYYVDSHSESPLSDEPGIYLREDLTEKTTIQDKNPLIRKFKVSLKGQEMMLVELQEQKSKIAEAFRGGIHDIFKLNRLKPESFLKFYGSVWEKKLCVLMEYAPFGDLLTYICKNPLIVAEKANIMYQIVNILGFMTLLQADQLKCLSVKKK
ncbi:hypothetical protein Btru_012599 [Bulinus truncatus]|nr:hypothetical protein Btru_012599 [Bulinus truncatus]